MSQPSVPRTQHLAPAVTLRRATFRHPFSCSKNRCWPRERPERRLQEATVRTPHVGPNTLPFQQFHVLFHSLFKVLFIFPSQYLFAIGLSPVFSLRWNLPPAWSCIPKQLDSSAGSQSFAQHPTGLSPSVAPCSKGLGHCPPQTLPPTLYNSCRNTISNLSSCRFTRRYWGNPCWFLFLRLLICLSSAGIPT